MKSETRQALVARGAESIELGGNEPIRLDQEPYLWLVEAGKVEIFAVSTAREGRGPRTHVATVCAGRMLMGIEDQKTRRKASFLKQKTESRSAALLAVGSPDTHLLRVPIKVLVELARELEHVPEICAGIEAWLSDLFANVSRAESPTRFTALSGGDEVTLKKGGTARTRSGVVWVRHLGGESHFLSRPELAMKPAGYLLPISDETWLESAAETTLSCVETSSLVRNGSVWEGLMRFHELYLDYIDGIVRSARARETSRLRRSLEVDRKTLGAASAGLASLLGQDGSAMAAAVQAAAGEEGGSASPLFQAAALVGEHQGFSLAPRAQKASAAASAQAALTSLCAASRLRHRLVILRADWWRRDNGPLLGYLSRGGAPQAKQRQKGQPVALLPTSPTTYEMVNPATGERQEIDAALAESLEGEAYMFYPPLPERPVDLADLARLALHGRRRDFTVVLAVGAFAGLLALLLPYLTSQIFGVVLPAADRSQLAQITLGLVAAAFASFGFRLTRAIAILRLSGKLDGSLQAAVWDRLLALPVTFYRRFTVGDLLARSMGIDRIRSLVLGSVATSFLDAVFSVFSFGLLFYYSWRLALVALGLVLLLIAITGLFVWLQVRHQRALLELQGRLGSLVFGLLGGIQKLRGAGAEARAFALWAERFGEMRRLTLRVRRLANGQAAFNATFAVFTTMALFAALHFWQTLEMSVGDFLGFAAAYGQFQAAALSLIGLLSSVLTMVPLYERLSPLLATAPEVNAGMTDAGDLAGEVELNHVNFRYDPGGPLILDDVSIQARPGEFIALVGPSGSGKSTTLRLLLGFEKPESGSVYFDGQDLPSLDVQSVRRQLGVVLQNGKPMQGNLYTNIVGSSNLGMREAMEAAKLAGLEEDIRAMPMGPHTVISEEGGGLSGGQVQRLMIARAIVHRPRILLFDEATSALDNRTQELVSKSLEALKATRIVVAHRLSTIRNADRIFVLEKGRVTEQGNYEELMAQGGAFFRLAQRQMS
ncbi:MAG: NHLP bacteriocin export ABC transporter permease/ATPase subunit [Acidobacteriota bacterium]